MHPYPNQMQHLHRQTQCRAQVAGTEAEPQYRDKPTFGRSIQHRMKRSGSECCEEIPRCPMHPSSERGCSFGFAFLSILGLADGVRVGGARGLHAFLIGETSTL